MTPTLAPAGGLLAAVSLSVPALAGPAAVAADAPELTGLAGWVVSVVEALGPAGVGLLVALENLFPPIPSEVILPVAGYVASQGQMSLFWAIAGATVGALSGAWVLYGLGAWLGRERLRRWLVRVPLMEASDVDRAEAWFTRFGGASVLIGRCVPVIRSVVSIPAGLERMRQVPFLAYTALGSAVWNTALVTAGYLLGEQWQDVGHYSDWINWAVYLAIAVLVGKFVLTRLWRRRNPAG